MRQIVICAVMLVLSALRWTSAQAQADDAAAARSFNGYILKAVETLHQTWGGKGYDINGVLSHDIPYGDSKISATAAYAPKMMCVSAQMEVILTAIGLYAADNPGQAGQAAMAFLPARSWSSTTNKTIRGHIWVNGAIPSFGTANALKNFGMGDYSRFDQLRQGSFVNFNREKTVDGVKKYSGHAVTFLSYIDLQGKEVKNYSDGGVVGFKYFSSNGYNTPTPNPTHGFGFRYAFFTKNGQRTCPDLPAGMSRDCDLIWPASLESGRYLNTGYMLHPKFWTKTTYSEKGYGLPGEEKNILFDSGYFSARGEDD